MGNRIRRMRTKNYKLCKCSACEDFYPLFIQLPSARSINRNYLLIPGTIPSSKEELVAAFKLICIYLNINYNLPYLSWEMGFCTREMIRILRQLTGNNGADLMFTQYSKFVRNV